MKTADAIFMPNMAPPFSSFMPDRTAVMGGLYENGSAVFSLLCLCHQGNHMGFFKKLVHIESDFGEIAFIYATSNW